MKTVVSLQELVDSDIRPSRLFEEFRALTELSVRALVDGALVTVACQACGSDAPREAFQKFGLTYRECTRCATVFVSPRPTAAALSAYQRDSAAAVFWRDRVLSATLDTRRVKLMRPRAEWVVDSLAEHRSQARDGVDISAQGEHLVEELLALSPALRISTSGSVDGPIAAPESLDVVTAFDTLDRVFDVRAIVAEVRAALRPGGVLFLTAPSISGFDLQVLWDRSPSVLPPDKLNLLSIDGFSRLFSAPGWEIIELSTPGMFDVENVRHAIAASPQADWPRAIRQLVSADSEQSRLELQEFLQRHRQASFARLVVRRRSSAPS